MLLECFLEVLICGNLLQVRVKEEMKAANIRAGDKVLLDEQIQSLKAENQELKMQKDESVRKADQVSYKPKMTRNLA